MAKPPRAQSLSSLFPARYCPQCGGRVTVAAQTHGRKDMRLADVDGFCVSHNRYNGCAEHLRRFDPSTGDRVRAQIETYLLRLETDRESH